MEPTDSRLGQISTEAIEQADRYTRIYSWVPKTQPEQADEKLTPEQHREITAHNLALAIRDLVIISEIEQGTGETERADAARSMAVYFFGEVRDLTQERVRWAVAKASVDSQDIPDIEQRTFANAWKGIKGYKGKAPFTAWLSVIARHEAVDQSQQTIDLREALEKSEKIGEGTLGEHHIIDLTNSPQGPEETAAEKDFYQRLSNIANNIPSEKSRHALALAIKGREPKEMAVILGTTSNTAAVRVQRAINDIAETFKAHEALWNLAERNVDLTPDELSALQDGSLEPAALPPICRRLGLDVRGNGAAQTSKSRKKLLDYYENEVQGQSV